MLWQVTARNPRSGHASKLRVQALDHADAVRRVTSQGFLVRSCALVENREAMRAKAQAAAFLLSIQIKL